MLASMQTSELTAYVLTLTLLSSERRRHNRSRNRRGHHRLLLLLRGGGREGTVVVSDMCPPLVSRLTAVPSSELSSVLASMQTSELTAYVLTLSLLSSERRRHSPGAARGWVGWSREWVRSGWSCTDGQYRQNSA